MCVRCMHVVWNLADMKALGTVHSNYNIRPLVATPKW